MTHYLNCRGKLLDISTPIVMGILNITPDSFYDGGKFSDESNRISIVEKMLTNGALLIDIGAVSSRPGAREVSEEEEWQRLEPVLNMMNSRFPDVIISLDTSRSVIAVKGFANGVSIINDITAGSDPDMFGIVAKHKAPYIMMHMQGTPATMQDNPVYDDVTETVVQFFIKKVDEAKKAGIQDIIIDPGFGFGKTTEHNFELLKNISILKTLLDVPVLAGVSRKSMINKTLEIKAADALNGTTVLNTIALMKGASLLRVHDVKEAVETTKLFRAYQKA